MTGTTTADRRIHRRVLEELKWDSTVDETEVGVEVDNETVTLTGTVSDFAKKVAAQSAAYRVSGVLDVANDIQIKVPGSRSLTDTEIAHLVRHALQWNSTVPNERIRCIVAGGWVTLEGSVNSFADREDAERAVWHLEGVMGLTNNIDVRPVLKDPNEVRREIQAALQTHAFQEARDIHVSVEAGRVVLGGIVGSADERQAVIDAVRHERGVQDIKDHLRVQSR